MFDDIPEDSYESYPCPHCNKGEVTLNKEGKWECNECDWRPYVEGDTLDV
jgi:ribosomal protein L37AE/L43A